MRLLPEGRERLKVNGENKTRMLTAEEGRIALLLARRAIEKYVRQSERINPPEDLPAAFEEKRGVFVTLKKHGELRGCIGYPYPVFKLKDALIDAAISAAVSDPRFPPVSAEELEAIKVEVTILTTPRRLEVPPSERPRHVEVGRHGLIVKRGAFQGLLLPQVAVEYNWDAEEFLCQTCWKAGLPHDAWLDPSTEVLTFEGQIFSEE